MHDGRFTSLAPVVVFFNSGVQPNACLDARLRATDGTPKRVNLSAADESAPVAFLRTLTDSSFLTSTKFSNSIRDTSIYSTVTPTNASVTIHFTSYQPATITVPAGSTIFHKPRQHAAQRHVLIAADCWHANVYFGQSCGVHHHGFGQFSLSVRGTWCGHERNGDCAVDQAGRNCTLQPAIYKDSRIATMSPASANASLHFAKFLKLPPRSHRHLYRVIGLILPIPSVHAVKCRGNISLGIA